MPPGSIPEKTCPTGGGPGTDQEHAKIMTWERFRVPQEELEEVVREKDLQVTLLSLLPL